jgi:hypothetical protein
MKSIMELQGVEATTFDKTLEVAGLKWEPLVDEVSGFATHIVMPRKKLLYRSDNKKALGVVGEDYEPSQPAAFLKTQFELAEAVGGEVARAGFCETRSRAFAFVKLGSEWKLPKSALRRGDPMQVYLYSTDGWDGGTPSRSRLYVERLVCSNGMVSREISADFWLSHKEGKAARELPRWEEFKKGVKVTVEDLKKQFVQLADQRMNEVEMKAFLAKLLPGDSSRVEHRRDDLLKLFSKKETGNLGQTRWDAYNAVTEYVTHERTYRKGMATVEENRFFGVLETDTMRAQAMRILLN